MNKEEYNISKEVKQLIETLLGIKRDNLSLFFIIRNDIKDDMGEEFYNKYLKEQLDDQIS